MPDHLMVGADRQTLRLPVTFQRFLNVRFRPAAGFAQRLRHTTQLRGGGHVRHKHASGGDHSIRLFKPVPRVKHVKHDAVEGMLR